MIQSHRRIARAPTSSGGRREGEAEDPSVLPSRILVQNPSLDGNCVSLLRWTQHHLVYHRGAAAPSVCFVGPRCSLTIGDAIAQNDLTLETRNHEIRFSAKKQLLRLAFHSS